MNVEVDRLSSLPNDLIHKIYSFIGLKHAVQTIILSSRYRFIWTSMPYLNLTTHDFDTLPKFSKFVTHALRRRNTQKEVSSVKLDFRGKISQGFVKQILEYALSHNVQQMVVKYLPERGVEFPLSLFSSQQSLKHLTLSGHVSGGYIKATSTWDLPALTTLYLEYIELKDVITDKCIDLFSKCPNLKNLTLYYCNMGGSDGVNICHSGLSDLTLQNKEYSINVLNLVAPQLKNITIRNWSGVNLLSAPKLASLVLEGSHQLKFSSECLSSLEKADLCIYKIYCSDNSDKTCAHTIVGLLQRLRKAKFLTLNMEMIKFLSSSVELISHQPSPFKNLKSLKVYPHDPYSKVKEIIPTEVKNYLLDSSIGATFTQVSSEEIIASRNALSAQKLMAELWVMLEQENTNTETSMAHTDPMGNERKDMPNKRKAQPIEKMKLDIERKMTQIKNCWNDVGVQIDRGKAKTSLIISKLHDVEVLLLTLGKFPTSKRNKLQESFSCLRAEVDTAVKKIIDRMNMLYDENQIRLGVCFRELASTYQTNDRPNTRVSAHNRLCQM